MNKTIIAERFSKAISTYPREANVQRQIADKRLELTVTFAVQSLYLTFLLTDIEILKC